MQYSDIERMVRHWLSTPPNGYLGSSYGCDLKAMLQLPNSESLGDSFITKMMEDIPPLAALPRGAVNLLLEQVSNDTKRLTIQIGELLIPITGDEQ